MINLLPRKWPGRSVIVVALAKLRFDPETAAFAAFYGRMNRVRKKEHYVKFRDYYNNYTNTKG